MKVPVHRLGLARLYLVLGFTLTFAVLTFQALSAGTEADRRGRATVAATLGVVSGPFTGAIARHFQPCCWQSSLSILPYSLAMLGIGVLFQVVPLPSSRAEPLIRLVPWCLGLLGWFGGALVSLGHALS